MRNFIKVSVPYKEFILQKTRLKASFDNEHSKKRNGKHLSIMKD